jgi:hypothetical protein
VDNFTSYLDVPIESNFAEWPTNLSWRQPSALEFFVEDTLQSWLSTSVPLPAHLGVKTVPNQSSLLALPTQRKLCHVCNNQHDFDSIRHVQSWRHSHVDLAVKVVVSRPNPTSCDCVAKTPCTRNSPAKDVIVRVSVGGLGARRRVWGGARLTESFLVR